MAEHSNYLQHRFGCRCNYRQLNLSFSNSDAITYQPTIDELTGVAATALIPLACRAVTELLPERSGTLQTFSDPVALAVANRLGVDLKRFGGSHATRQALVRRSHWFDRQILDFVAQHSAAQQLITIVNFASGFDSGFSRLANRLPPSVQWIDSDLPIINSIKQNVFPSDPRHRFVDFDLRQPLTELEAAIDRPSVATLYMAEGILMYLPPSDVHLWLGNIASTGAADQSRQVLFDWCSPLLNRFSRWHPGFRHARLRDVCFDWSIRDSCEIQTSYPTLHLMTSEDPIYPHLSLATLLLSKAYCRWTGRKSIYGCARLRVEPA